jgi:hypothetical protein
VEVKFTSGELYVLRGLLKSGRTATMLFRKFDEPSTSSKYKGTPVGWSTLRGVYTTKRKAKVNFCSPEFFLTKSISWICNVDQTTDPGHALYNMIVGSGLI